MLPNGNVLVLVWDKIDEQEAEANGAFGSSNIYPEKLVEINQNTNAIVCNGEVGSTLYKIKKVAYQIMAL